MTYAAMWGPSLHLGPLFPGNSPDPGHTLLRMGLPISFPVAEEEAGLWSDD